jgi:hypothetical protein
MSRLRPVGRRIEVGADRGPMAVTILLLLVLGGQAREVGEVAGVAAQAYSVAVALADETECRVQEGRVRSPAPGAPMGGVAEVRPAPRSRSPRSHAWPSPRAPTQFR